MIEIRRAASDDAPALHALIEGAYRGEGAKRGWTHEADLLGGQRTDLETLGEILSNERQSILIAEEGEDSIGCVHLKEARQGVAYLGMLTVDPARQSGGLGRQLLDACEAEARRLCHAREIEMTVISSRNELIAWYERRGYHLTGERRPFPYGDERFGLPRTDALEFVVMAKRLGAEATA